MAIIYNLYHNSSDVNIRNSYNNIYDNLSYEDIYKTLKKDFIKDKIYINFSSDKAISAATIACINELYSYRFGQKIKSDLKVIYISPSTDMFLNNYDVSTDNNHFDIIADNEIKKIDYQKSVVSNLLSISTDSIKRSYTKHLMDLELEQFIFLGLNDIDDENILIESKCKYYTNQNLSKKLQPILESVTENKDHPVAIIFDINCINPKIYSNTDDTKNIGTNIGFNIDQLNMILKELNKMNIRMIDIVGFKNEENLKLKLIINKIYLNLTSQPDFKLNVFDEESRFLIFKPLEEIYDEKYGFGWYILRNINKIMQNEMLSILEPDNIIMIDIPDDDNDKHIMISSTSINEQNEKCYYLSESYKDCCLYPDEKLSMCFELVNN
jgi:arginase family enzyme